MSLRQLSAELDDLLESLDPRRIGEDIELRLGAAAHEFCRAQPSRITQWPDFLDCVARGRHFMESRVIAAYGKVPMEYDMAVGRAVGILHDLYGENGEKYAFELARTGKEGGMFKVISDVAGALLGQWEETGIKARISQWWESLDVDDRLEVTRDYVRRYSNFWPSEMAEAGGVRLRVNFPKTLLQHARLLRQLRCGRR